MLLNVNTYNGWSFRFYPEIWRIFNSVTIHMKFSYLNFFKTSIGIVVIGTLTWISLAMYFKFTNERDISKIQLQNK